MNFTKINDLLASLLAILGGVAVALWGWGITVDGHSVSWHHVIVLFVLSMYFRVDVIHRRIIIKWGED